MLSAKSVEAFPEDFVTRMNESAQLWFPTPEGEEIPYSVRLFGGANRWHGRLDMSDECLELSRLLRTTGTHNEDGTMTVYAPRVDAMSGVILDPERFVQERRLPLGVQILRTDVGCDGIKTVPKMNVAAWLGGCAWVVASGEGTCFAFHAGLKSVIDMLFLLKRKESRFDFSVIDALRRHIITSGKNPVAMIVRVFFQLDASVYAFPLYDQKHAYANRRLRSFIKSQYGEGIIVRETSRSYNIDLGNLIGAQARDAGFGSVHTHCKVLPADEDFFHTRHPRHDSSWRNLVTFTRM